MSNRTKLLIRLLFLAVQVNGVALVSVELILLGGVGLIACMRLIPYSRSK